MAKLLLLDTTQEDVKQSVKVVECEELDDYYRYLQCGCFDIAHRKIGGKYYDIFVDDEGLFKDNPIVSAITPDGHPMLVGNLIFANHDAEGNTTSLTEDDINNISKNLVTAEWAGEIRIMVLCDY